MLGCRSEGREGERETEKVSGEREGRNEERERLNHTPFSIIPWAYGCECVLCTLSLKGRML